MTDRYLNDNVRYRAFVHGAHEGQIGPDAEPWEDGEPMHYAGITIEHRTADADFDGRAGHVSWKEAGWCPGAVTWCDPNPAKCWQLVSFEPLTLTPSIQCHDHPSEFHVFVTDGKIA